jgi:hypothetical protein
MRPDPTEGTTADSYPAWKRELSRNEAKSDALKAAVELVQGVQSIYPPNATVEWATFHALDVALRRAGLMK